MGRLLSVAPWTRAPLELRDFGRFAWEEDSEEELTETVTKTAEEIRQEDEEILKMIQGNG